MEDYEKTSKRSLAKSAIIRVAIFIRGLQIVLEYVFNSAYSIFGFDPLHNLHLTLSNLSKKCTSTYLESDTVLCHPEKMVLERMPLGRIYTCILRDVSSMLAKVKRDSSIPEL